MRNGAAYVDQGGIALHVCMHACRDLRDDPGLQCIAAVPPPRLAVAWREGERGISSSEQQRSLAWH